MNHLKKINPHAKKFDLKKNVNDEHLSYYQHCYNYLLMNYYFDYYYYYLVIFS